MRGSHLLPSQLPREHTGHKAASRCSEPIWNATIPPITLIAGTHFINPQEGWKAKSTASQEIQELAVSRYQSGDLTDHSPLVYQLSYPNQFFPDFFASCHFYTLQSMFNRSRRFVSCAIGPSAFHYLLRCLHLSHIGAHIILCKSLKLKKVVWTWKDG